MSMNAAAKYHGFIIDTTKFKFLKERCGMFERSFGYEKDRRCIPLNVVDRRRLRVKRAFFGVGAAEKPVIV